MTSQILAAPTKLRCEYHRNPLGIDATTPRLGWQLATTGRDIRQRAYQIRVADSADALNEGRDLIWDSTKVMSDRSIHVPYGGPALTSTQRCYWQVRIWDQQNTVSEWSETACWEMGLLQSADWQAAWIEPTLEENPEFSAPGPLLRGTLVTDGEIKSARAYVTAKGLYELWINNQRIGDEVLTPGWTAYDERLQYQTYDVTQSLQRGKNAVGAILGDGWYRGNLGFQGQRNTYGSKLGLLLQLAIEYADGRLVWWGSDENWRCAAGPILASDIYNGETYDARDELEGWATPSYTAPNWAPVRVVEHAKSNLVAPVGPPIRRIEEIRPVAIIHTPAGETVFDLGQNMVGWVRLQAQGLPGTTITLRHAEVLDQAGNLYTTNLRTADQMDRYTLKGDGVEIYEPRFTFHGFRYVAVEGYPGIPSLDDIIGVVVHSDLAPIGQFECSKPLLNQLQHNIRWGQKGNFVDVPTDCPQRDERLGWTGDAQVFIRTACFNMDVAAFFAKWLRDLAADQRASGSVPHVIPDVLGRERDSFAVGAESWTAAGSAAWADAAVICPWTIYLCYGDTGILDRQYESMKGWVEFMRRQANGTGLWQTGFHFGDWLAIGSADDRMPAPGTDKDLIATAFYAYSTQLLAETAGILGKAADAVEYTELLAQIRAAFQKEFVTDNVRLAANSQTAYVLALMFDLLSEAERPAAAKRLVADIRARDNHLSTGFVGAPYLCHVLSDNGYLDVAYQLLNQESFPSWLYPVKMGATTIWERWDGIKPDGSFQDAGMNSFNHYAYGAIGDWMYRVVAGIEVDPQAPGYKHALIQPQPGGGLTYARASLETPYGQLVSEWRRKGATMFMAVTIPPNATATIRLPQASLLHVVESGSPLTTAAGIHASQQDGRDVVVRVGSGSYQFRYPLPPH